MCTLKISKRITPLYEIENFIENIFQNFNIKNSLQGNIIISITELVSIVTSLGVEAKLSFENLKNELLFRCEITSAIENFNSIFHLEKLISEEESDYEKSVFLIKGLCDDFIIDDKHSSISILIKKEIIENEISSHRKEYLKNYLGKSIESYT